MADDDDQGTSSGSRPKLLLPKAPMHTISQLSLAQCKPFRNDCTSDDVPSRATRVSAHHVALAVAIEEYLLHV